MLRPLVIVLLLITGLFAQVSTAYACSMTGAVVMHDCCCDDAPDASPDADAGRDCCRPLALIGDSAAGVEARIHAPAFEPDDGPPLVWAVTLRPVPEASATAPPRARAAAAGSGARTWLHTARLRL